MSKVILKRILQAGFFIFLLMYVTLLLYRNNEVLPVNHFPIPQQPLDRWKWRLTFGNTYDLPSVPSMEYGVWRKSAYVTDGEEPNSVHEQPTTYNFNNKNWTVPDSNTPAADMRFVISQQKKLMAATPRPVPIIQDDVFISVKTTKIYHESRLAVIIKTWFRLAKKQTWFFTDTEDPEFQRITSGHMVNTNCSSSHNRKALCCKMAVEFDSFLDSGKRWFCHFDDDNYVNVPRLINVLSEYNEEGDWYLGKPSIRTPLEILNREHKNFTKVKGSFVKRSKIDNAVLKVKAQNISFWFATGGAGFCLSRTLAWKMAPIASKGKFMGIGDKIRLPDDVTMGYIVEYLLGKPLTVIQQFHSHLEPMKFLQQDSLHKQITFSYSQYSKEEVNVLKVDGFDLKTDPTR